jgi:hypothetical protein
MLVHCLGENWTLLSYVFYCYPNNRFVDTERVGEAFLDLLQRLGLDVGTCISGELECFPGNLNREVHPQALYQSIIFEPHPSRGSTLRWEWVYDSADSAYLVASEHNALSGNAYYQEYWPFREWESGQSWGDYEREGPKWETRLNRRMDNKARKERTRTDQKWQRSKMPGTWGWYSSLRPHCIQQGKSEESARM